MVAEAAFAEWISHGSISHPSFQGLREDKNPKQAVRKYGTRQQPVASKSSDTTSRARNEATPPRLGNLNGTAAKGFPDIDLVWQPVCQFWYVRDDADQSVGST